MKKLLLFVLVLCSYSAFSQGTLTGTVIDSDSKLPLSGANVIEMGTSNGTITDFDGNFTLETQNRSGSVVISYIGFDSERVSFTITTGSLDLGTIEISPDTDALSEVVIVGHGIIDLARDRQTPIAVSTITTSEIQAKAVGNVEFPEVIKSTPSV